MNRTPSLWRAWSPVVLEVAGVLVATVGIASLTGLMAVAAGLLGGAMWLFGFTQGSRLNRSLRKTKEDHPAE